MLQSGRSRFRVPMRSLDFFNLPNPFRRTMDLGSTQSLTEMSTRNLPGCKGWPAHKADLTAICEPIVYKMWEPGRLTTLWSSTACYRDSSTFFILHIRRLHADVFFNICNGAKCCHSVLERAGTCVPTQIIQVHVAPAWLYHLQLLLQSLPFCC
jgi:hypothetical protein